MFCKKCGNQLSDDAEFCPNCGTQTGVSQAPVQQVIDPFPVQQPVAPVQTKAVNQPVPENQYSMKWFKFLTNFALFAGALVNFVYGFNYITGSVYSIQTNGEATADMVYAVYGSSLKTVDVLYGVMMLLIMALSIFTRVRLVKFKKDAPICVYALYGGGLVIAIIYVVLATSITGVNGFDASTISSIITSVFMLVFNYLYFSKRKSLFTA